MIYVSIFNYMLFKVYIQIFEQHKQYQVHLTEQYCGSYLPNYVVYETTFVISHNSALYSRWGSAIHCLVVTRYKLISRIAWAMLNKTIVFFVFNVNNKGTGNTDSCALVYCCNIADHTFQIDLVNVKIKIMNMIVFLRIQICS